MTSDSLSDSSASSWIVRIGRLAGFWIANCFCTSVSLAFLRYDWSLSSAFCRKRRTNFDVFSYKRRFFYPYRKSFVICVDNFLSSFKSTWHKYQKFVHRWLGILIIHSTRLKPTKIDLFSKTHKKERIFLNSLTNFCRCLMCSWWEWDSVGARKHCKNDNLCNSTITNEKISVRNFVFCCNQEEINWK